MASFIKLERTPIKEIIFTISFKENVDDTKLDAFASLPLIKTNFPIVNKGFNTHVQALNNQAPTTKVSLDGFVLRSGAPHKKVLQARKGSLALHIVNGYENFNNLTTELNEYWQLLISCCGELTVNGLSVRYLNFIELKDNDTIEDLITINTKHPFGNKIDNTFTQHKFAYDKNPTITINVVSTIGKNETRNGIILDIILNKIIENKNPFNFDNFDGMRDAKNDVFFKSITENTINRYN